MSNRVCISLAAFAFGLCLPVEAGSAVAAKAPLIPVERFATLPVLQVPILSPDGRWIAARAVADGKTTIAIIDADQPRSPPRAIALGKTTVASLSWAGNTRLLLTVRAAEKIAGGYDLPFLRLIVIDVWTGQSRIVDRGSHGTYAGDVLYSDPTGSWALVASQDDDYSYPSVKRVDLATGSAKQVEKARERVWDWYADESGIVRAGVAFEGRRWTVWYRDKADEKLRPVRGKFDKDDDSTVDRFIFRGNNSWVVTNERNGRFGLYKYDLAAGTIGAALFEHPTADIDNVYYEAGSGEIRAVEYEDDRKHLVWMDPALKALQAKLDKALPGAVNLPFDWSLDENRYLIFSEGASDPGRYFLLDRKTQQMHAVVDPYPLIDPAELAETKWVNYTARDGLALSGYLTIPKGREAKNLPLILMPHGGPFERDHWEYDPEVQFLANRGYAVFQPQFRGSTGFGKDFVAKGYGEWGKKMQDDLDDGVEWLVRGGTVDSKRVCIVGASYGGYAAMWAAIRNSDRYRCAASLAGVSDLERMMSYDRKAFTATRYFKEWRTKVSGESGSDLRAVSPITYANRLKIPILIGHGEDDDNVLPAQSRDMVAALTAANAEVESVFYPGGGHGWNKTEDLADWLRRLEAFLAKNNPA